MTRAQRHPSLDDWQALYDAACDVLRIPGAEQHLGRELDALRFAVAGIDASRRPVDEDET
jgi:hypothetical protein